MKKQTLWAVIFAMALMFTLETPILAAGAEDDVTRDFFCGTSEETQQENFSALIQKRIEELTGISPYFGMGIKNLTPSVGEARLLVLPIAFSDSVPITDSWETDQEYYEKLYFGPDNGGSIEEQSVQTFFSRQSYGRLSVTGDVLETYHAIEPTINYASTKAFNKLVTEALAEQDIDYERYDADNDGFVDCLVLAVRKGTCDTTSVFSVNWAANVSTIKTTSDRIKVKNHVLVMGVDNFTPIHELLHCMGLSDNYKLGNGAGQCIIPRIHDEVMSSGYHVNSFYKYLLGWIDPVIITDNSPIREVKLFSIEKDGAEQEPKAVLYIPDAGELPFSEFFIAEYRNGENYEESENAQLRASQPGITLWHCNGTLKSGGNFEHWGSYLQAVCPSGIEDSQNFSNADRFVPSGLPWSEYSTSNAISPDTPVNSDFHDGGKTNFYMKVVDMNDEYATLKIGSADTGGHTHSYSDEWTADTVSHWHECECGYETVSVAHTPVEDAAVEPTCTVPGKTAGRHCSVCGYVIEAQEEIPARGHSYSDKWWSDGSNHWHACSWCLKEPKDIAPHIEDAGVVIKEPTVTSRGVKRFSCAICGYRMRTEYIPKLEPHTHEYSTDWKSDGDHHWHECECGERTDEVEHTAEADTAVEPTCTTPGKTEGSHCSMCGYVIKAQREIPAKGHSYAEGWSQDEVNHWRECTECGEKTDVAAHTEDKGTVTKRPTEEEPGVKTFCCSVCGRKLREEAIDKLPPVHIHEYSADWKSDEVSHWHECKCEERAEVAPHLWDDGEVTKAPTSTQEGTRTYTCTVCARTRTESIPATGGGSSSSGGGGSVVNKYRVTVDDNLTGGMVTVTAKTAKRGEKVTVTAEPWEAYTVETVTVTDGRGREVELIQEESGKFTFAMPGSKVTVTARFAKKPTEERPPEEKPPEEKPGEPEKPELPFADVRADAWYYATVEEAYRRGLMAGISENQFEPEEPASRGMVVTILYRMEGEPDTAECEFSDVPDSSYCAAAVAWAMEKGIVKGCGDRIFRPDDPIVREELATILYRYASCKGQDMTQRAELSSYVDAERVSGYAYEPLSWANAAGLISGTDWGGLHPGGKATRAETAAVFLRYDGD